MQAFAPVCYEVHSPPVLYSAYSLLGSIASTSRTHHSAISGNMYKSIIFTLSAIASLTYAQSIPTCAISCVTTLPANCGANPSCICADTAWIADVSCCVKTNCAEADQQAALSYANTICTPVGVTLPTTASCASNDTAAAPESATSSASSATSAAASSVSSALSSALSSASASVSSAAPAAATYTGRANPTALPAAGGMLGALIGAVALL